jgi:F0F1-type ATP synthase assembly protein I
VQRFQDRADIASIGLEMGGCVIAGYFIGSWFDGRFDLAPWGTAFFLVCGFGAAVKGLVRVVKRAHAVAHSDDAVVSRPIPRKRFRQEVRRSW